MTGAGSTDLPAEEKAEPPRPRPRPAPRPKAWLAMTSAPGLVLELAALGVALSPGGTELSLGVAGGLLALGLPMTIFAFERYLERTGRDDRWALLALLGPIGLVGALRLTAGPRRVPGRSLERHAASDGLREQRCLPDRVAGVALSLLLVAALVWAAVAWLRGAVLAGEAVPVDAARNERLAFERLRAIAEAQARYVARDWNGDGRNAYAEFVVHLWRSVDAEGHVVDVGLIQRDVGFAMVPELALDGYLFRSLHWRSAPATAEGAADAAPSLARVAIDPETDWAVVALPLETRKTGRLQMLADGDRGIWVAPSRAVGLEVVPAEPEAAGWRRVRSVAELAAIQRAAAPPAAAATPW